MNWQSLVIIGIIVILFIILMIINASTADLDQDNAEEDVDGFTMPETVASDVSASVQSTSSSQTEV